VELSKAWARRKSQQATLLTCSQRASLCHRLDLSPLKGTPMLSQCDLEVCSKRGLLNSFMSTISMRTARFISSVHSARSVCGRTPIRLGKCSHSLLQLEQAQLICLSDALLRIAAPRTNLSLTSVLTLARVVASCPLATPSETATPPLT
jgi:hypothetical protein